MHRCTGEVFQHRSFAGQRLATAFLMNKPVGMGFRRGGMQPLQLTFHTYPGFIKVNRSRFKQAGYALAFNHLS